MYIDQDNKDFEGLYLSCISDPDFQRGGFSNKLPDYATMEVIEGKVQGIVISHLMIPNKFRNIYVPAWAFKKGYRRNILGMAKRMFKNQGRACMMAHILEPKLSISRASLIQAKKLGFEVILETPVNTVIRLEID